jgi:peptidyl-prolyl cis-trans isomerase SurA
VSAARLNFLVLSLMLCLSALPVAAQSQDSVLPKPEEQAAELSNNDGAARIVVVVNDAAITNADIVARYSMILLSSGLPDAPENRARILPQALRSLVDEQVQLQEARRQRIDVSQAELDQALNRVAQENGVPGGDMRAFFKARGVPIETLENQLRTSIAWGKLVQRQLRPRVEVTEEEVDEVAARRKAAVGKTEYFINEIFLAVDEPEQDAATRAFADKLLKQIKETGAFGAVARQFSQGAGAKNGGEIGWVPQGSLAPELDAALKIAKSGALLGPIKTERGYHILAVRDSRKATLGGDAATKVKLAQITRAIQPSDEPAKLMAGIKRASEKTKSCSDLAGNFPEAEGWGVRLAPEQSIADLPPPIAAAARSQIVGTVSEPDLSPQGVALLAVCERSESAELDRSAIMNAIGNERLETLARGLLRDLKRNAFIDRRG